MSTNLYALLCYGNKAVKRERVEGFKLLNGFHNIDREHFFVYSISTLRWNDEKLFKPRRRLDIGKFTFSNRVTGAWNSFPHDVIDSCTVNAAKLDVMSIWYVGVNIIQISDGKEVDIVNC